MVADRGRRLQELIRCLVVRRLQEHIRCLVVRRLIPIDQFVQGVPELPEFGRRGTTVDDGHTAVTDFLGDVEQLPGPRIAVHQVSREHFETRRVGDDQHRSAGLAVQFDQSLHDLFRSIVVLSFALERSERFQRRTVLPVDVQPIVEQFLIGHEVNRSLSVPRRAFEQTQVQSNGNV